MRIDHRTTIHAASWLVWGALLVVVLSGCTASSSVPSPSHVNAAEPPREISPDLERRIAAFCGDCHRLPRPESFARDRWHFEVRRGYEFYAKSGRTDLNPPPLAETLAWFRHHAPEVLTYPVDDEATDPLNFRFEQEPFRLPEPVSALPEIAFIRWESLGAGEPPVLLASDIRHGNVVAIDVRRENRQPPRVLAQLRNPARIEVVDLNADGLRDLVIADLGSYLPADHNRGRLIALLRKAESPAYDGLELLAELGRVADVQAIHADGDDQPDLVVAEFGWRDTGSLRWGRNETIVGDRPRFDWFEIDDRPGVIDVRAHDFTGDKQVDLVALFSQEYESVELFANRGAQQARLRTRFFRGPSLGVAPDLTFGSSGIELADLNDDGQMDVIWTNGDAFDNAYVSPWHGVQWLENRGNREFALHRLADLPGAYRALPGDFDRDGRIDILVAACLPSEVEPASVRTMRKAALVLLRQIDAGQFERRTLEWGVPYYTALEVADLDDDGDLDFVTAPGPYVAEDRQQRKETHYLTVWWNQPAG